jgi:retinol dehydrogenase-14
VLVADHSSQSELRSLADEVLRRLRSIDLLVNNVGGYWRTRHITVDGLERTFALNHLAPFLLTDLLLDRLIQSAPARVVTVASHTQASSRIDFDDLQGERSYSGARAYSQRPIMKTPAQGAATSIPVASAPDLDETTGLYFANRKPKRSSRRSLDAAAATRLRRVSAELVGLSRGA